ncbi:MAG: D-alanyl-D-alanine carboxypeptidase family protein [Actinomycetes bacterium]|jgi:D-alanyl-D-alanine carboxypeptidase
MTRHLRAAFMAVVLCSFLASPAVAAPLAFPSIHPEGMEKPRPPHLDAASWILYDASAGIVLTEYNADEPRAPASITKIMTVLLALENADPDDMVTVSNRAAATGEREIGLVPGEQVPLGALMRAALIHSANDAATAIAEHVAGSVDAFAEMMNARAEELGMTRTHFVNPHGLDATGHVTTARDMLTLGIEAMKIPQFRQMVGARKLVFPDAPDGTRRIGESTNLLVGEYPGANGIKTGFTNRALLTIVASAERDGRELYTVVMGTMERRSHFEAAKVLFDYGFEDLYMVGVAAGVPYRTTRRVADEDPLAVTAGLETQVLLGGEGLLSLRPEPPQELPDLPPPPAVVATRHPDGATGPFQAVFYWFQRLLGS